MLYLVNILIEMSKYSTIALPAEVLKNITLKHRQLRKELNLTQAEIADRSGVSLGSVKRFERLGKISLESFLKLLLILGRLDEFNSLLKPMDSIKEIEHLFSDNTRR